MFKEGDYVVYKRDVCHVSGIREDEKFDRKFYILEPVMDASLTIQVPVGNEHCIVRKVITKKEANDLINKIPQIPIIEVKDKLIENEYKSLYAGASLEDLVRIIKTTYLRNSNRIANKKKPGEKDSTFFKKAENCLYSELSVSLGMTLDETREYIKNSMID